MSDENADYREAFGRDPEPWRAPLGALRLTLADESAPAWQLERARTECEELVKVLNEKPSSRVQELEEFLRKIYLEEIDGIADEMTYSEIDRSNRIYAGLISLGIDPYAKVTPPE